MDSTILLAALHECVAALHEADNALHDYIDTIERNEGASLNYGKSVRLQIASALHHVAQAMENA